MIPVSEQSFQPSLAVLRPEHELILSCVRAHQASPVSYPIVERIQSLTQQALDWDYLIDQANSHGVVPLLYAKLKTLCPEALVHPAAQPLQELAYKMVQRNILLTGELVQVLRQLQNHQITAVPYKGPVLATALYQNIGLRFFSDLDILVQKQDVLTAKQLLIERGYLPKRQLSASEEIAYLNSDSEHTYDFVHPDKRVMIELHWRIAPHYLSTIEPDHLWADLQPCAFNGMMVPNLSLEQWLPILCVHASRHCWERLIWLCDIAELLHRCPTIDWEQTIKRSRALGCRRMLVLGILLCHRVLGSPLPDEIKVQVQRDPIVNHLAMQLERELFRDVSNPQAFLRRTLYHTRVRERWQDKGRYLRSFVQWLFKSEIV